MWKIWNTREDRIKNRIKSRKKRHISIILIIFAIIWYFFFSNEISVDEKTWAIKIEKKKIIKKEDFEETYTWTVFKWLPFDIDIDIQNVYLTWTTIKLYFSNNSDFKIYKPYSKENLNKIRYWFMLWKERNRNKVFWLWKNLNSVNTYNFSLNDVYEDKKLGFKVANLDWASLFVKLEIKWEKIIK